MDKDRAKIMIQQQQEQIQSLEVDNSNLSSENLRWQDKYGDLHMRYVQLKRKYDNRRK